MSKTGPIHAIVSCLYTEIKVDTRLSRWSSPPELSNAR